MPDGRIRDTSVLIAEMGQAGHRLVYVQLLARRAREKGASVSLAVTADTIGTDEYRRHLATMPVPTVVIRHDSSAGFIREISRVAKERRVDHVVIPDGDTHVGLVPFLWNGPHLTVLMMRDPRGEVAGLKQSLINFAKAVATRVASSRRRVRVVWLGQFGDAPPVDNRSEVALDPYISHAEPSVLKKAGSDLRRALQLDEHTTWFAMVGSLSRRKNVQLVIEALQDIQGEGTRVGLVLFGPQTADIQPIVRSAIGTAALPIRMDTKVKSNDEINAMVYAADVIVTAYSIHYPNSTLVKALASGTCVVVAGSSFVQERARRTDSSVIVSSLERHQLAAALRSAARRTGAVKRVDFTDEQFSQTLLRKWW